MISAGDRPGTRGSDTESAGFVLAGGASRRMGTAKALLDLDGTPLVQRIAQEVTAVAGSAIVIGPQHLFAHLPLTVIEDLYPGEGPLGGIITALTSSKAERNLIVACDMPRVSSRSLARLLDLSRTRDAEVTMPVTADGWSHPICAVYRSSVLPAFRSAWSDGVRSIKQALKCLKVQEVTFEQSIELANVNTPADWRAIRRTVS